MSDILQWIEAHADQAQSWGLVSVSVLLVLALIQLNRVASELHRSRSQRLKAEQTFERLSVLLASRGEGLDELRISRRVSLSGPVQRSVRPVAAKADPKAAPRVEPRAVPTLGRTPRRGTFH